MRTGWAGPDQVGSTAAEQKPTGRSGHRRDTGTARRHASVREERGDMRMTRDPGRKTRGPWRDSGRHWRGTVMSVERGGHAHGDPSLGKRDHRHIFLKLIKDTNY